MSTNHPSDEVTALLDSTSPPLRGEIDKLRKCILSSKHELLESVKWNGPNYSHESKDRITIRIGSPNKLQVIFHRGAKVAEQPNARLLKGDYSFLVWKENDRAVATFNNVDDFNSHSEEFAEVVDQWIEATGG